ncbi:hypothetical protein TNIN_387961, partial [Trichonephila inaurata madagascariensis]
MEKTDLWLFTEEHLFNTPSRGLIDETNKSFCRKQDANFIQEMGGSLEAYPFWFKYVCRFHKSSLLSE